MVTKKQLMILDACRKAHARAVKLDEKADREQSQKLLQQAARLMRTTQRDYRKVLLAMFADAMAD